MNKTILLVASFCVFYSAVQSTHGQERSRRSVAGAVTIMFNDVLLFADSLDEAGVLHGVSCWPKAGNTKVMWRAKSAIWSDWEGEPALRLVLNEVSIMEFLQESNRQLPSPWRVVSLFKRYPLILETDNIRILVATASTDQTMLFLAGKPCSPENGALVINDAAVGLLNRDFLLAAPAHHTPRVPRYRFILDSVVESIEVLTNRDYREKSE